MKDIKWSKWLTLVGILVIIYILLHLKGCKVKDVLEYWQDPTFKTDTIYLKVPYEVKGDSFAYKVPPKVIIRYLPLPDNGNKVKCSTDSLLGIIDSMGKEIQKVNKKFLTNFPKAEKLIYGYFKSDSLKLDLLSTQGVMETKIYLTNYNKFKYEYKDNQLRADTLKTKVDPKKSENKLSQSLYGSGGYEIVGKTPTISLDYYLKYKMFQVAAEPQLLIMKNPELMINLKLGYRIK